MKIRVFDVKSQKGKILVQAYSKSTFQSGQFMEHNWWCSNFYIPLDQVGAIVAWAFGEGILNYVRKKYPYHNYLKMIAWITKKSMTKNAKDKEGIYHTHFVRVDYPSVTNFKAMLEKDGESRFD